MSMDTKFSVALHILAMISESRDILSSQALAESVGTNPSYIRKVIALLKKAEIISSQQGKSGYELTKSPREISLLEIYFATQEVDGITLFPIHQNTNVACPVGNHIEAAISPIFASVEEQLEKELQTKTMQDIIDNLYDVASKK